MDGRIPLIFLFPMCRLFLLLTQLGYTCGELSSDVSIKRKKVLAQMRWEDYGEVSLFLARSLVRSSGAVVLRYNVNQSFKLQNMFATPSYCNGCNVIAGRDNKHETDKTSSML